MNVGVRNVLSTAARSFGRRHQLCITPRRQYASEAPTDPATDTPSNEPSSSRNNASASAQSQPPVVGDVSKSAVKKESTDEKLPELNLGDYPNLITKDPFLDVHEAEIFPRSKRSPYESKVILRNDPNMFLNARELLGEEEPEEDGGSSDSDSGPSPASFLHLNRAEQEKLFTYTLVDRRVIQQTSKGRQAQMAYIIVVGNQNGLVGIGQGKSSNNAKAFEGARIAAIRNMDYVERFENRTIWTEMEAKFGSTRIFLRPRPVGFGLHCNPNIYMVLKAAGIKDASAKVWGSRNPIHVTQALTRMLHAGNAPLGMGDGVGGKGRTMEKGVGMLSREDIERARGRKMVDLRLR
ncbi:hypothetical protein CERSUDRAFT_139421 [Gelatoporia subvermispora B]|uniref:Small ribosomal subunit protein uS5m n=1 Tax=Ceriporiopsis subvermispora (strain B) TaxID=914234 RepID=M2PHN2_CERS8|nr:hypothetical protein CERSUDRAFT_139421 [Gelatoporia subvermispora B]